jgi:DNA-binding SARP family transcriptional activator/TolB-like protein/Tfp pilus assembly protein PilF
MDREAGVNGQLTHRMFDLKLFGSPTLTRDDVAVSGAAVQRHRLALLALLAMAPGRRMSRDKLIAHLWPDRDADGGRNLLKVSTYVLRSTLGENALLSEGDDLRLNTENLRIDVAEFDAALGRRDFVRAAEIYRAPFLDGFFLRDSPEFDEWSERERVRLAAAYRTALESLAQSAEANGQPHEAVDHWRRLATHDPYDSRIAAQLMRSMARVGNRAGALQHASVHERLLRTELGVDMPAEIVALAEELKRTPDVKLATSPLPAPLPDAAPAAREALPSKPRRAHSAWLAAGLALLLLLAVVWPWRGSDRDAAAGNGTPSIAVLPFENIGNPDEEYFAAGMTDEITSRLGAVSGLGVVPSRATERYARGNKTMREIGRELGVDYVLLGNVRWAAPQTTDRRVRVTLELLRTNDERQLWSNTYDRVINDIFEVQSDIATQVTHRLGITLAEPERARLTATPAENHEAYTLYLKGRYFWNKRTENRVQTAQNYFQQAVDLDPSYSLAWVGLADVWIFRGWYSLLAPKEAFPKAKEAALRALQFDSTLAEAHASLAHIHFEFDHDWAAAEREYRRAIQLKPNYAIAHHWYGGFLSAMGRHREAQQHAETARTLDPIAPIIQTWKGLRYYFAGQPAEAIAEYEKAIELDQGFAPAYCHLGWAFQQAGRLDDGITMAQRAIENDPESLLYVASLAHAYAVAGKAGEARAILERLSSESRTKHVSAYHVAMVYVALGDTSAALEWLERAYEEQSPWIGYLKVDPRAAPLRSQPRFQQLVRQARL